MNIKILAFDADDTLWHNESYFQEIEKEFCELLEDYLPQHSISKELFKTEMQNMELYGYGVKAFMLSMIETALRISEKSLKLDDIEMIIGLGKGLLAKPVENLDHVQEVLTELGKKYRLVMATKGDLLDQERKLGKSGLENFFHHIEIVSEKNETNFRKLVKHLDIRPEEFGMIGNSLKSDIIPVLNIGGYGFHVPYHVLWDHEKIEHKVEHPNLIQLEKLRDILQHL